MEQTTRILVVEDDPDLLAGTVRLLEAAGWVALEATDGKSALEQARKSRPDLVLLDVELPDIDGLEVCRIIKAEADGVHPFVIFLSGKRVRSDEQSLGLEAGGDGYIARPISNRELLARVQAYVRLQKAETALRASEARLKTALAEKDRLIEDLQAVLREVKTLSGLIPICAGCKKVRDDDGFWSQVETYLAEHSEAKFSHGLCPKCISKYFAGYEDEIQGKPRPD